MDGHALLDTIKETGIRGLEIDYRIQQTTLNNIKNRLQSSEFDVLSVHAICPRPDNVSPSEASAELYDISSDDIDEHKLAVKHSIKTLELAADLEARIVIFHLGNVKIEANRELFFKAYEDGLITDPNYIESLHTKLKERRNLGMEPFDRVLQGINKIHQAAYKLGVLVGVENRYFFNQIPFGDEFDILFDEFKGGQLRYWHDVGHAELFHRLAFLDHKNDLLEKYKNHLGGMHIHDIKGLKDHLAPGLGDFDFSLLKEYLTDDVVKILEIHDEAETEDIINGIELLNCQGIF